MRWKLNVFLHKDILLNTCVGASTNSTSFFHRWTLRCSFLPLSGEERLGGRVCLAVDEICDYRGHVLKLPESWMSVSIFYSLKTFRSNLIAFFVFSGTPSSCILRISNSETLAKREFTPAILFLFGSRIVHSEGHYTMFFEYVQAGQFNFMSVFYIFGTFYNKTITGSISSNIYNIDRTQCPLWLVENPCFIRVYKITKGKYARWLV